VRSVFERDLVPVVREHRAAAKLHDEGEQTPRRPLDVGTGALDVSGLAAHAGDAEIADVIELQLRFEFLVIERIERHLGEA
jgi:hypothetical protein